MRARIRFDLVAFSILMAAGTWGCGDSGSSGGSTISMGGSTGAGMAGASGSLTLGGSTPNGGSAGQMSQGGSQTGGGGTNSGTSGGGSTSMAGMGQGGSIQQETAGTVTATIDGKKEIYDVCRITRQVAETQFSIDAKKSDKSLNSMSFLISVDNGPGSYGCTNNQIIHYDDAGNSADVTADETGCTMNVTAYPSMPGESFKMTFSAKLSSATGTVMVTDGTADLTVKN